MAPPNSSPVTFSLRQTVTSSGNLNLLKPFFVSAYFQVLAVHASPYRGRWYPAYGRTATSRAAAGAFTSRMYSQVSVQNPRIGSDGVTYIARPDPARPVSFSRPPDRTRGSGHDPVNSPRGIHAACTGRHTEMMARTDDLTDHQFPQFII